MSIVSEKALIKAQLKRKQQEDKVKNFNLEDHLFAEQLAFVKDTAPFVVAVCSRRAGKSTAVAAELVMTALTTPDCTALYITGSRADAKKIIWTEVLKFNRKYNLGGEPNLSELVLRFPNGSLVRLEGARDEQDINKIRGQMPPPKKVFIDEAQSIRNHVLRKLIDDVLEASLMDYAAQLYLLGTPGPIPAGYYYEMSHNLDDKGQPLQESVWSIHNWTFFNNPFIPAKSKISHKETLARVLKRRGVTVNDPSIQREYFGKWTVDSNSLLVQYNAGLNHYALLPNIVPKKYAYILGIDLGFNDADALAVLAYSEDSPVTYLVEEVVTEKQGITELVNQIRDLQKTYDISKMVIDGGGLGKKIAEELIRRHSIPVEIADKARKMENIAFLNDSLRTGRFKAKSGSKFAQDSYLVEIDKDKSTPDKIKVSDRYHSDIIDAVLYAFKCSPAYAYQAEPEKPRYGSKEWAEQQEDDMFQAELEGLQREAELQRDPFSGDGFGY